MAENLTLIDAEKIPTAKGNWEKLAASIIANCAKLKKDREKEILVARFGIGKSAKTLNGIGTTYGITRERVRQIVNNAIKKIQKTCDLAEANNRIQEIEAFVRDCGGFAAQEEIFKHFEVTEKHEQNAVRFIASLSKELSQLKESNITRQGFIGPKVKQSQIKEIIKDAVSTLKEKGEILGLADLGIKADNALVESSLRAAKQVMETDESKWGLSKWPHVNPKSIRDKSKYIMVRHGEPIHYSLLTQKISDFGTKNVTKQSVHNELIKNTDFVLVGRGIYALREWGYNPGVVEEVIVEVLNEAGKPLHKNEIIDRVLEKRIVKASTVILNLQKNRFKRVGKAVYTLN
jgi:DNA-directed RNA polymerase specialized sigma subunit